MTLCEAFETKAPNNERYRMLCGLWESLGTTDHRDSNIMPKNYEVTFMKTLDRKIISEAIWCGRYNTVEVFDIVKGGGCRIYRQGELIHSDFCQPKK